MNTFYTQGHGLSTRLMTEEEFSRFRKPWNTLLDASRSESFFLKWEWMYTFWDSIDKQATELQVWLCHDGSRLVGIAPLYSYKTAFLKVPVRKLAFLGDRVASDYLDVFAAPGYEDRCCGEVMRILRYDSPVTYDILELDGLCTDSNLYRYLSVGDDAGKGMYLLPRFDCPRTILDTSFNDYMLRLSASTRYSLGRMGRKFKRQFGEIAIEHLDVKKNPHMLGVLFDLHRKRWGALKGKRSTFSGAFRELFNNRLVARLDEGDGFFSCMNVDDDPVSILYIFVYKNNAFFYQNGWNPEYASYGVGLLNILQALRHAIDTGFKSFDFLRGEEAYKYKFCEDSRQAYAVLGFGTGLSGKLARVLFLLKTRVKDLHFRARQLYIRFVKSTDQPCCLQIHRR